MRCGDDEVMERAALLFILEGDGYEYKDTGDIHAQTPCCDHEITRVESAGWLETSQTRI